MFDHENLFVNLLGDLIKQTQLVNINNKQANENF